MFRMTLVFLLFCSKLVYSSLTFEEFTEFSVSLELNIGHISYLLRYYEDQSSPFKDELDLLGKSLWTFANHLLVPAVMELYCGNIQGEDQLYNDILNLYQYHVKNPWISILNYQNIDTSVIDKDLGNLDQISFKIDNRLRQKLKMAIDTGNLRFKTCPCFDEAKYHISLRKTLFKHVTQKVHQLFEEKVFEVTGLKIKYSKFWMYFKISHDLPYRLQNKWNAIKVYSVLPDITFKRLA